MIETFFEILDLPVTERRDLRLEVFKALSYSEMTKRINDLQKLLEEMKKIRATRLESEIIETEEKLKKLKENLA